MLFQTQGGIFQPIYLYKYVYRFPQQNICISKNKCWIEPVKKKIKDGIDSEILNP